MSNNSKDPPKNKVNTVSSKVDTANVLTEGEKRHRLPEGAYRGQTVPTARGKKVTVKGEKVQVDNPEGAAEAAASSAPGDLEFTVSDFVANSTTVEGLEKELNKSTLNTSSGHSPDQPPKPRFNTDFLQPPRPEPTHLLQPATQPPINMSNITDIFKNVSLDDAKLARQYIADKLETQAKLDQTLADFELRAQTNPLLKELDPPKEFSEQLFPDVSRVYVTIKSAHYVSDFNAALSTRSYVAADARRNGHRMVLFRKQTDYAEHDSEAYQHMSKDAEILYKRMEKLDSRILSTLIPEDHGKYLTWSNYEKLPLLNEIKLSEGFLYEKGKPVSDILPNSLFGTLTTSKDERTGDITSKIDGPMSTGIISEGGVISKSNPKISEKDLEIIRWNGTKTDFWRFKDSVDDLFGTYEVNKISWIRKFNYLKQCLSKEEQKRMITYAPDQTGWETYWEDMVSLFGDTQQQVFLWMEKLRNLPYVTQGKNGNLNIGTLNAHHDEAKVVIRWLTKFGKTGNNHWQEFLPHLTGKLDINTSMEWNKNWLEVDEADKKAANYDPVQTYMDFIKKKIDLINKVKNDYMAIKPFHKGRTGGKINKPKKEQVSHNETFFTATSPKKAGAKRRKAPKRNTAPKRPSIKTKVVKRPNKKTAAFESKEPRNCFIHPDQSHKPWDCPNMGDGKALWSKMYTYPEKVCQGCLYNGHYVSKCKKARVCNLQGCTHKHHRKLHFAQPHYISYKKWSQNKKRGGNNGKK